MFALIVAGHEKAAQQLTHRRFWQGIDKDEAPGTLEICKPGCPAELFEVLLGDGAVALDESGDDRAPVLISEADDGDFDPLRSSLTPAVAAPAAAPVVAPISGVK